MSTIAPTGSPRGAPRTLDLVHCHLRGEMRRRDALKHGRRGPCCKNAGVIAGSRNSWVLAMVDEYTVVYWDYESKRESEAKLPSVELAILKAFALIRQKAQPRYVKDARGIMIVDQCELKRRFAGLAARS